MAQTDTTSRKLNEVTIIATSRLNNKTITSAQQINSTDFIKLNALNVADAVRNFAGVNVKDYGGIGGLKTISVRSLGSTHTAVLLDGVQINDAQNGQIDLSKFVLTNVSQVALFNGQPDDLLQPARAFAAGSVLSVKSIVPNLSIIKPYHVLAGVKGGSFGLVNPYFQWQQRLNASWSLVANANYTYANGRYKYKVEGDGSDTLAVRRNGDVKALQADAAVYWHKSDSSDLTVRFNYYNSKRGLPGAVIFYNPYTTERLENEDAFVQAKYSRTFKNSLRILLSSKVSQLKTRYLDPQFLNTQGYLDQHYRQREAYQSAAIAYQLLPGWEVSYAVDASYIKMDADIYNYAYPGRFTLLNVLASKLTKGNWMLQGNLLQTNIGERVKQGKPMASQSILKPTLMASFKPFDHTGLLIRAFYKDIFRAPTLDELYFYAILPRTIKPEDVKQYNLGATYQVKTDNLLQDIELTSDAYYNHVANKILAIPNKNPAIYSFSNIGKVDIKGIDVTLKIQTHQISNWSLSAAASYTFQKAIDVSDESSSTYLQQIPYTPKHTLALNAGVNCKAFSIYVNHLLSSHRYYTGNNLPEYLVPGYGVTDASAIYHFKAGAMPAQLSVEANNLSNKNYSIIRSYPMPGRSYRLSFQITI
ncbi:TonB-dependent receptor plug domain-containing protein [Mucilaginibacter pallidiroseus]|nr:TonB-dependent receptor plug domain-containing protein [Mucilaginibacter pallidiroseus]